MLKIFAFGGFFWFDCELVDINESFQIFECARSNKSACHSFDLGKTENRERISWSQEENAAKCDFS